MRNHLLSFFKGLACIFVVFMHIEFPSIIGVYVQSISRWSVPLFFMISGYFCVYDSKKTQDIIPKKTKNIIAIITEGAVVYFIYEIFKAFSSTGLSSFAHIDIKHLFDFVFFNEPVIISGHLWFLFALLYTYVVFGFVYKSWNFEKFRKISPFFLVVVFICGQVFYNFGINIPNHFYRNFLFEAIPFFIVGYNIRINHEKLMNKFSNKSLLIILSISTILCIPERILEKREFGLMVCSLFQVFSIFILSIKNPDIRVCCAISKLGDKYSFSVYLYHIIAGDVVVYIFSLLKFDGYMMYLVPLITVCFTILLAIGREIITKNFLKCKLH